MWTEKITIVNSGSAFLFLVVQFRLRAFGFQFVFDLKYKFFVCAGFDA